MKDPAGGGIKRKMPFLEEQKVLGGSASISLSHREVLTEREKVREGKSPLFASISF